MVVLNRIYTRTGDTGSTALGSGARVAKFDLRIEAFGTVDEANAAVGLARLHISESDFGGLDAMLARVQNDLFDLGADLCVPDDGPDTAKNPGYEPLRIVAAQTDRLEAEVDAMNAELDPLRSFVLPGGTHMAAALHLARTIARRAERRMVELAGKKGEIVSPDALKFINRLSDFLFVASRYANYKAGSGDVLWSPGKNR